MNEVSRMNAKVIRLEITTLSLKILRGESGMEVPLERGPGGMLTSNSRQDVLKRLRTFLDRKVWQPRFRAICAVAANGVSLRQMSLPATAADQLHRVMLLQIETEFPLPPEALAWGCHPLPARRAPGEPARHEILVAAVKKEVIEAYASLLGECGLEPVFTVAALARAALCPPSSGKNALLSIGANTSELLLLENDAPTGVRVLPFGSATRGTSGVATLEPLAEALGGIWNGKKLCVVSADSSPAVPVAQLAVHLPAGTVCEALVTDAGPGRSAALSGLKKIVETDGGKSLLLLQTKSKKISGKFSAVQPDAKKWAIRAATLLLALVLLPYAEALLLKPHMTNTIARIKAEQGRLSVIDREKGFLQYLKENQPPYLDALYIFSKSAGPGFHIDGLNMGRHGEISLRASLGSADQVVEFRKKLIDSGFFSSVVVEEQTPVPNNQKVTVRLSLQWKSPEARAGLVIGPSAEEIQKALAPKPATGAPGMALPPGVSLPPGFMPN